MPEFSSPCKERRHVTVVAHEATNWRFTSTALGNAWWFDGRRCNAASTSECWPKIHGNGLTYAESSPENRIWRGMRKSREAIDRHPKRYSI